MTVSHVDIQLPEASAIDYTNADEICGYQLMLCKVYGQAGGFERPSATNAAIREALKQGCVWLREVKPIIDGIISPTTISPRHITLGELPDILSAYDILFRLCNGSHCLGYIREVKLKAVDRWLKGDKTISETEIALMILSEVNRDARSLERRYSEYALGIMERWIDELTANGNFANIALSEAYRRLTHLLNNNLYVYLGRQEQPKAKARWISEYTLTDSQIDTLDTKTLRHYIAFANAASRLEHQSIDKQDASHARLISHLLSRPDLHPFYRQALAINPAQPTGHPSHKDRPAPLFLIPTRQLHHNPHHPQRHREDLVRLSYFDMADIKKSNGFVL